MGLWETKLKISLEPHWVKCYLPVWYSVYAAPNSVIPLPTNSTEWVCTTRLWMDGPMASLWKASCLRGPEPKLRLVTFKPLKMLFQEGSRLTQITPRVTAVLQTTTCQFRHNWCSAQCSFGAQWLKVDSEVLINLTLKVFRGPFLMWMFSTVPLSLNQSLISSREVSKGNPFYKDTHQINRWETKFSLLIHLTNWVMLCWIFHNSCYTKTTAVTWLQTLAAVKQH